MKIKELLGLFILIFLFSSISQAQELEKSFFVRKINISGNSVISKEAFSLLLKDYEDKNLNLSDLERLTSLITAEYKRQGYILANAYLPGQEIIDGIVEICVSEGKIGEIKIQGKHRYYSDEFILGYFKPLLNKVYNQKNIERSLLLLNEYPKLKVSTLLQPGKTPGTTDIIVMAENIFPIELSLDYDNFGSKYVSRDRFGATLDISNLLKEGAILSLGGLSGIEPNELLFGRASYEIPLNNFGSKLSLYYCQGDFDVGRELEVLNIGGRLKSYGISIKHPFLKTIKQSLIFGLSLNAKNTKQYLLSQVSSYDRIRSIEANLSYETIQISSRSSLSLSITQGLGEDFLDAMDNDSPYSSRYGADNRFTKFNLNLMHIQRIFPSLFLLLKGSGQFATDSLVASEQFYLGGANTVRGYSLGEISGDMGYSLTGEFRISPLKDKEIMQIALFVDTGYAEVKNPVVGQKKDESLTGAGAGLRFNLPFEINIRFDVGFPVDPSETSDGKDEVYYIQVMKKF